MFWSTGDATSASSIFEISAFFRPHARFMGRCVCRQHILSCFAALLDGRLVFEPLYDMANKSLNELSLPLT